MIKKVIEYITIYQNLYFAYTDSFHNNKLDNENINKLYHKLNNEYLDFTSEWESNTQILENNKLQAFIRKYYINGFYRIKCKSDNYIKNNIRGKHPKQLNEIEKSFLDFQYNLNATCVKLKNDIKLYTDTPIIDCSKYNITGEYFGNLNIDKEKQQYKKGTANYTPYQWYKLNNRIPFDRLDIKGSIDSNTKEQYKKTTDFFDNALLKYKELINECSDNELKKNTDKTPKEQNYKKHPKGLDLLQYKKEIIEMYNNTYDYEIEKNIKVQFERNNVPFSNFIIVGLDILKIDKNNIPINEYKQGFLKGYNSNIKPFIDTPKTRKEKLLLIINKPKIGFRIDAKTKEFDLKNVFEVGFIEGERYKIWEYIFETPSILLDELKVDEKETIKPLIKKEQYNIEKDIIPILKQDCYVHRQRYFILLFLKEYKLIDINFYSDRFVKIITNLTGKEYNNLEYKEYLKDFNDIESLTTVTKAQTPSILNQLGDIEKVFVNIPKIQNKIKEIQNKLN